MTSAAPGTPEPVRPGQHEPASGDPEVAPRTVEEAVRAQLATALGGRRGMVEAAVPTIAFTVAFLTLDALRPALIISVGLAVALLVVRLVQHSSVQFVVNALFGIGLGALFAFRSLQSGGTADDAALAYFLPGILYNAGYAVVLSASVLVRWPFLGFLVGSVTGDATAWRHDPAVVRLCSRLTWLLVAPCVVRVLVQAPLWLGADRGFLDVDTAIGLLGTTKILLGWPLQIAALSAMVWVLARNRTPYTAPTEVRP